MGTLIKLAPREIHLWLAFYEEISIELHPAYRQLLSAKERQQEHKFLFATDRRRYLITRVLVRTVLSRYAPIDPIAWVFTANTYGRPEIANPEVRGTGLSFNLSHTRSLVVLGIKGIGALGVDVENIAARRAALDVADRFFAPEEVTALRAIPPQERQRRFFEYWTLKESYIKARGMGLSLPLEKFSFHYPHDGAVGIDIDPELADDAARWQFWQLQPRPEYLVAVCSEGTDAAPSTLVTRVITPAVCETVTAMPVLRASPWSRPE